MPLTISIGRMLLNEYSNLMDAQIQWFKFFDWWQIENHHLFYYLLTFCLFVFPALTNYFLVVSIFHSFKCSATLLLVPLLGMQYILTPFRPEEGAKGASAYELISAVIISFQVGAHMRLIKWLNWKFNWKFCWPMQMNQSHNSHRKWSE